MQPSKIADAYNQIAHIWESDEFDQDNGISQHNRAISFTQSRGFALDVGCGCSGRFIDLLLTNSFDVEGVDISDVMIHKAQLKHPNVKFYRQDICEWDVPGKYDFITAWDSIWHVPLTKQAKVILKLIDSLKKYGIFIFTFGGTNEPGEHTNSVMGPEVYYSTLGINGFLKLIIKSGCVCRHLELDQYPELHAYMIAQKV